MSWILRRISGLTVRLRVRNKTAQSSLNFVRGFFHLISRHCVYVFISITSSRISPQLTCPIIKAAAVLMHFPSPSGFLVNFDTGKSNSIGGGGNGEIGGGEGDSDMDRVPRRRGEGLWR